MVGFWAGLAGFGYCAPGRSTSTRKRSGVEAPAPRGHPAVAHGSGSQKVSRPSPHMAQAPGGCWAQYLSHDGESFKRLMTTSLGHCSVIRRSSKSRLCRADAVLMHAMFS